MSFAALPENLRKWASVAGAAAVVGGMLGWYVHGVLLTSYRATIAFPLISEVTTYRRVEDLLFSVEWFREFAKAYNVDPSLSADIDRQLSRGQPKPLRFEHAFRIQRSDLRDLPEPAMKEMAPSIIKDGRSDLVVSARDDDPVRAAKLADLGVRFARHVLLRVTLTDWIPPWRASVERERVDIQAAVLTHKSSIDSLMRRIKDLEALRDRYREVANAAPAVAGVQVQVTGPRYLAISQQLVGLESELVDLKENLRQTEESMAKIETTLRMAIQFERIFRAEANTENAVKLMEAEALQQLKQAEAPGTPLASRLALTTIWKNITGHRDRYIDGLFSPPAPVVRIESPPRSLVVATGALLALGLALLLFKLAELFGKSR